jgi:hypothetical protein
MAGFPEKSAAMNIVETIKFRAPLAAGRYIAAGADLPKPREISDRGRQGVSFTLKVVEGAAKSRLAAVEIVVQAKDGARRAARDLDVLAMWCDALGVDSASTLTELIGKLRAAAVGKRVEFELGCHRWSGGVDVYIAGVRLAP